MDQQQYINIIKQQINSSISSKQLLLSTSIINKISQIAEKCVVAYKQGKKIIWAGNGGSAADAQHMSGEMVSKFCFDRPGLPSIALSTDTSILTAIGNDYGFEHLFARQLQANGVAGDIFIGFSTSGNSKNLVEAKKVCDEKSILSVALVGNKPCLMDDWNLVLKLPSSETPRIQEMHTLVGHMICCIVERELFG